MRATHFARYFGKLPDKLGQKEVKEYLLHLVKDKHASYGVFNMTYCALKPPVGTKKQEPCLRQGSCFLSL